MKRSLTAREWILLAVLVVVAGVSAYVMLFYMPMTERRDIAIQDTALYEEQIQLAQLRITEQRRMQKELDAIFAADPNPVGLAPYDNVQPVMMELHAVLEAATNYSLSFSTVDAEQSIVRRSISLSFQAPSYESAREILQNLHDSAYRCMLESLSISFGDGEGEQAVSVNGVIVFFEYQ